MELGEKIKKARLEAGLSQRQLCGDAVTRNMLSQIENGSARPSMDTLKFFAARLGKTLSYFLEEDAVLSPNQQVMRKARDSYDSGAWEVVLEVLKEFQEPDDLFCRERDLLKALAALELARAALEQGKDLWARQLLEERKIEQPGYCIPDLCRRRGLILGCVMPEERSRICRELPSLDEELLLRANEAFAAGNYRRAGHLLDAVEIQNAPWHLLQGKVSAQLQMWEKAAVHLRQAEIEFPDDCFPLLEICYRELGDFQKAYEHACRQRK